MTHADSQRAYDPVKVEIANPELLAKYAQPRTGRTRRGMVTRSFTLTASDPVQEILPQSDKRCEAWITSITSQQLVEPANPAASGGFSVAITQPCQLASFSFLFTAASPVNNRFLNFSIQDAAGNVIYKASNNSAVVATTNVQWSLAQGSPQVNNATGAADAALPLNLTLQPGWTLNITVTGEQTGDQISGIAYVLTNGEAVVIGKSRNDVQAAANSGAAIPASGTPQPINTTDQVWAGAAFLPTIISVVSIYEQAD